MNLEITKLNKKYQIRQFADAGARMGVHENFYFAVDLSDARKLAQKLSKEARTKNKKLYVRIIERI